LSTFGPLDFGENKVGAQNESQIRSTNPLERLSREVKRRANLASIFPKEYAIVPIRRRNPARTERRLGRDPRQ
jgi:transposase-like protein